PVLPSLGAHLEKLGQNLNAEVPNRAIAPYRITVDGHNELWVLLDGEYWKNVTIKNARIVYKGGPIQLENVYFVNCTFDMQFTNPAVVLARKVLDSPSVTLAS